MATAAILVLDCQASLNVAIAGSENTGAAGYSKDLIHLLISNKFVCAFRIQKEIKRKPQIIILCKAVLQVGHTNTANKKRNYLQFTTAL